MTVFVYFTRDEFACKETGENEIKDDFISRLDELRERCGFPFRITSGYRSPRHSIEAVKSRPGQHTTGRAADIAVNGGEQRYILLREAFDMGFPGIGPAKDFVHVDERLSGATSWVY